jgi:hypothetical protein
MNAMRKMRDGIMKGISWGKIPIYIDSGILKMFPRENAKPLDLIVIIFNITLSSVAP